MSTEVPFEADIWSKLLVESQAGNKDSYRRLLELVYDLGGAFLAKRINKDEVREEILQEAVLAVHRGLASYDRSYSGRGWVYSVFKNKLVDHFRKAGKEIVEAVEVDMLVSFADPEGVRQDDLITSQWLENCLQEVPEAQRIVFIKAHFEDLEMSQIATQLGISVSNVKVSLHRARVFLKEKYFNEGNRP